jgi:hypothetical protein
MRWENDMSEERSRALAELSELGELFEETQRDYDKRTDEWWESLSEDQRQDAFYSVVKRLVKGELRDRGTYRYVLYDVFGFDASSYVMGMNCGYMELHNSIYTQEEMRELRDRELASQGIKVITKKVERKNEQHLGDE